MDLNLDLMDVMQKNGVDFAMGLLSLSKLSLAA